MKKILFEISKEHPTLPRSEAKACLEAEGVYFNAVESNDTFLFVEAEASKPLINRIAERVAFSFFIDEVLFISPPSLKNLLSKALSKDIEIEGSFRVRCENHQSHKTLKSVEVEQKLGEIYAQTYPVNIKNPDAEIRVILTDERWYVCKKSVKIDRSSFEARKVQHRPFFSPISLHPRLARAMVNLSKVAKGETLLDPFCGTGGILLEAGLIGVNLIGGDIQETMVDGCKKTLDVYNIKNYNLFQCDISEIPSKVNLVDAVVTDFPYGRAATTNREKTVSLYKRAFKTIDEVLKEDGRAVVTLPNMEAVEQGKGFLRLEEVHPWRVHKSLTRYITVYEKK
ncbi:MAG: methyltransferase domain-containing protein [Thermoplasmata archaeon]|nr:methyltransferase domain-containing protein [Thermoplasmata archaeon]